MRSIEERVDVGFNSGRAATVVVPVAAQFPIPQTFEEPDQIK